MFPIKLTNNPGINMVYLLIDFCKARSHLKYCASILLFTLILTGCQSNSPAKISNRGDSSQRLAELLNSEQAIRYEKAIQNLQAKNYSAAELILFELSKERPNFAGSWVNLGLIKLMLKEPVAAKLYVERALQLTPNHPQALNLMGLIATHDRDIKLAEGYYLKAIELSEVYANAHYNLALLYDIYLQDIQKAVVHYQSYLQHIQVEDKKTQGWVEHLQSSLAN